MKNHFEMRGKACRLIFDPSTDQFAVAEFPHPFAEAKAVPPDVKTASVTELAGKRRSKLATVPTAARQRRLG
jgi:hypothetical protein